MENDFCTAALKASVLSVYVVCVSTVAASLPHPCIPDLKDIFVNCPGLAHFQAKDEPEINSYFDNNKMLSPPLQPEQPGGKLQKTFICYLRIWLYTTVLPWSDDKKSG